MQVRTEEQDLEEFSSSVLAIAALAPGRRGSRRLSRGSNLSSLGVPSTTPGHHSRSPNSSSSTTNSSSSASSSTSRSSNSRRSEQHEQLRLYKEVIDQVSQRLHV